MASAEVREINRQGAPGTDIHTAYELGAEIDGVWVAFVTRYPEDLQAAQDAAEANQRAQAQPADGGNGGGGDAASAPAQS